MSWLLVGFPRQATGLGVEHQLPDSFTEETARSWFGANRWLTWRLWPLSSEQAAVAARLVGAEPDTDELDFFIIHSVRWKVEVFDNNDDSLHAQLELPESFTFVDAAQWVGGWHTDLVGSSFPLQPDRVGQLGEMLAQQTDTVRYSYFLECSATTPLPGPD